MFLLARSFSSLTSEGLRRLAGTFRLESGALWIKNSQTKKNCALVTVMELHVVPTR